MQEQKLSRSQIFKVYTLKEQAFEEFYSQEHRSRPLMLGVLID